MKVGRMWKAALGFAVIILAVAAQAAAARPAATPAAAARPAEGAAAARATVQEILAKGVPGLAVSVAVDGAIIWSEGFGLADLESQVAARPTTRFRIGSVSKPLTAAALALLHEEGKLDLDAPIQRYVPGFPDKGQPITARLLAGHLAGIRHYKGEEFYLQKPFKTVTEGLSIFKDDPLEFPPGTKYGYSSYGYNLLSAVLEGASGKDFLTLMEERVFEPLGMRLTVPDQNEPIIDRRARFYSRRENGKLINGPYVDNSYKWAGGGFLSTTEDLVRFGMAHLRPGFLKPESLALLFTSQRTTDGKETGYGIGWGIDTDGQGRRRVSHGGGSVGGTARLALFPDQGVVVAILCNLGEAPCGAKEAESIAEPFLKARPPK